MRYVLEDTSTGFKLTIESPAAVWRNEGGLSHRRTVEMAGSHSPLAFAYAELERVNFNEKADEAERGYDVSDQPPTLPTVWLAELVSEGAVKGRVVLTTREMADQALAGKWRVVRYVRADMGRDDETQVQR